MRKQGGLLEAGALLSSAFKTYPQQTTNSGSIPSIVITIRCKDIFDSAHKVCQVNLSKRKDCVNRGKRGCDENMSLKEIENIFSWKVENTWKLAGKLSVTSHS